MAALNLERAKRKRRATGLPADELDSVERARVDDVEEARRPKKSRRGTRSGLLAADGPLVIT